MPELDTNAILTEVVTWIPNLVAALLVFVLFLVLHRVTRPALRKLLTAARLDDALVGLLLSLYRGVVVVLGAIMAVSQLGVDVAAALAGLGVVGLTVGFAAKDSLSNVIAGFLIFWDKPFQVGDWVTIEGTYGKVSTITMRTTRIRTPNNTYVVIPNQTVIDELIVNHSKHGETRVDVPVGIAYKEHVPAAREALLAAVPSIPDVLDDPAPEVVLTSLGDSSVNLELRVWIGDASHERPVLFAALEAAKRALDEADIEIPFPHLQLFVDDVADGVWKSAAARLSAADGSGHGRPSTTEKTEGARA